MEKSPTVLLSMKPCYADMVFNGEKKAELRKRIGRNMQNRDVLVYVTSPVRQLRGGFHVGLVRKGPPKEVWNSVSSEAGINRREFDAYYSGSKTAYALKITSVWQYEKPLGLSALKTAFENFVVPRSWRYLKPSEERFLKSGLGVDSVQRVD